MSNAPSNILVSKKYTRKSRFAETVHRIGHNKGAVAGFVVLCVLFLVMLGSFLFINYDQVTKMDFTSQFAAPSREHIFGTDDMGRDLFLRTIYGTRYSFAIGFGALAVSITIGVTLGVIAGFFGGWLDDIIMRVSDILASIPGVLLGMVIVAVLGQSLINLIIAVGIGTIPDFARYSRASVIIVKSNEYIESARAIGMPNARIAFFRALPNSLSPLIVLATTMMGGAILAAAGLSFLGFGITAPTPEWGALISQGRNFIRVAPHISFFPGIFIFIHCLSLNLLGDGLRDALDPKLKK